MTLRPLTAADRSLLAGFTCSRIGEPWTEAVQHTIRHELAPQIATGVVTAVGRFDQDGRLCGLAAWRIYDVVPPVLCRGDIVAVAIGQQRKGHGRVLKNTLLQAAREAGAVAVSSVVHRENRAMIHLNQQLGAVVDTSRDDDHCFCVIPL